MGNYAALKLLVINNFAIQQTFNVYQIFSQTLCEAIFFFLKKKKVNEIQWLHWKVHYHTALHGLSDFSQ